MENQKNKDATNPIDEDKITHTPHILPYAHTVAGSIVKPIDKGRVKGLSVSAMYEQTDKQLHQIRQQIELLADQAETILERVKISEKIYQADMNFQPLIGHNYHLYERKNGQHVLSMIGPQEWGRMAPYTFVASAKLLSDHTWEIMDKENR